MKKNSLLAYISLGIAFLLFNVIAFIVPTQKSATFWIAYAFSVVAFISQIVFFKVSLDKKDTLKSKFLGIPIIHVGLSYLIIQLIAFAIFMFVPTLAPWIATVACSIILAISALCAIAGQVAANEINRVEDKIKLKRAFIQFMQADVEMLMQAECDKETKEALRKLAESVRFSDPMSHELLFELETRISAKVDELKSATDKKALIGEIELLLTERNKKCKILK